MKYYNNTQSIVGLTLWGVCLLMFVINVVTILESAAFVYGQTASGWYIRAIKAISIASFLPADVLVLENYSHITANSP